MINNDVAPCTKPILSQSRSCTQSNWDHTLFGVSFSSDKFNGLVNLLVKCYCQDLSWRWLDAWFDAVTDRHLVKQRLALWPLSNSVAARRAFPACSHRVCPGIPGIASLCGPAAHWQLAQVVTSPSPSEQPRQAAATAVNLRAGGALIRIWMNWM